MAPFTMNSAQPSSSQIPLATSVANLQIQFEHACNLLERIMQQQQAQTALMRDIIGLLDGFTCGGASFAAHQTDPMTLAYLAVTGPQMFRVLSQYDSDVIEILKAAGPLSRRIIEEHDAYRSQRGGVDYLEEQAGLLNDPWEQPQADS